MSEKDSNERTFTLEKSEEDNNFLLIESELERNIVIVGHFQAGSKWSIR